MNYNQSWTEVLRLWLVALTTPALAAFAGWIAYQQYRLQQYRLRHDLCERRFAIFLATLDFVRSAVVTAEASDDSLITFDLAAAAAPFLFGEDVNDYLARLRASYCTLLGISDRRRVVDASRSKDHLVHAELSKEWAEQRQWLRDQLKEAQRVFLPYLDLTHAR